MFLWRTSVWDGSRADFKAFAPPLCVFFCLWLQPLYHQNYSLQGIGKHNLVAVTMCGDEL
jgi:hypothetical protein